MPACSKGYIRRSCGGFDAGTCEFDCDYGNCYQGPKDDTWYSSVSGWSLLVFPTYPQQVAVEANAVVLHSRSRGTADEMVISDNGKIVIDGGSMQIGPTTCDTTEFETRAPTVTSDRECRSHRLCTATQWESKAADTHSDRVCTAHTTCTATQYETTAAGTHHDRVCTAHTVCTATQWQTVAAGTHNDRACQDHTTCTATQWETVA